jgi:hypothetical protein
VKLSEKQGFELREHPLPPTLMPMKRIGLSVVG